MSKYRLELPPGPFGAVLADPPWMLTSPGVRRDLHYDRMTTAEIADIPVHRVCLPDSHLWLWTTNAHLPEALVVVELWGFDYKSLLTWDKCRMATGWWLRGQTEHVIFAARSKKLRQNPGSTTTLVRAKPTEHSVKPEEVYKVIERLSPGPYLELFARKPRDGWTTLVSNQTINEKDNQL